jgi:hypothetical protein
MKPDIVMADFERHRGKTFHVAVDGGSFAIVLVDAEPVQPSARPGGSFSLMFTGPASPILNQGMYEVRCGDEQWPLFIVPLGPRGDVVEYQVLFN